MTLSNVITFDLLQHYDGKIKDWTKTLRPAAAVLYTAEDAEVIAGTKEVGDVKVSAYNGGITADEVAKLANLAANANTAYDSAGSADTAELNAKNYADGLASNYDAAGTASSLIEALDATESLTAGADGLSLSVTLVDGVITGISGSIAANTYDASGAAAAVLGDSNDASTAATVYGAKAYANSVAASAELSAKAYADNLVAAGINYKGSVNNYSALSAISNPKGGDMYNVKNDETISNVLYPGDMNYIYVAPVLYVEGDTLPTGKEIGDVKEEGFWDPAAPTISLSTATVTQINGLFV